MKATKNSPYPLAFCLTFLVASISSCANQNQSNQNQPSQPPQEIQIGDDTPSYDNKIDTTLQLKYTTGVRSILEDSKGNFWFGSHQEGVCLFDGEQLTYFTIADGLSDNQIRSIFEDSNGTVWFEGGKGISSYDGNKIITHTEKNYSSKDEWQTGKNDIWFKSDESSGYNQREGDFGVYRYDGNALNYHVFPLTVEEGDTWSFSVSTPFAKGKNGMVWFGTYSAVIGYDGTSFTIINNKKLGLTEATGYLHVRSIFEDSKGNLWIGNNGIGVLLYDGDTTINFSKAQGLISKNSLNRGGYRSPSGSLEHVFSIGEDNNGIIWFGDRDTGAWRYDGKTMKNYTIKDGLTTTHIWHIYKDKKGKLWFALGDGSVCQFNGKSFDRIF